MTKEPLHETVLRVAFLADTERPALLSTDDIFWKIEDPGMIKTKIKDVLLWLVHRGEMEAELGKYKLSRPKFFELKEKYAEMISASITSSVRETIQASASKKKARKVKTKEALPTPKKVFKEEVKQGPTKERETVRLKEEKKVPEVRTPYNPSPPAPIVISQPPLEESIIPQKETGPPLFNKLTKGLIALQAALITWAWFATETVRQQLIWVVFTTMAMIFLLLYLRITRREK